MSCCVLCLETNRGGAATDRESLDINSTEGKLLNIQHIIETHLWILPKDELEANAKSTICTACWNSLHAFHQFYLRIKKSHEELNNEIQSKGDAVKIEVDITDENSAPVKRRRGRPRKLPKGSVVCNISNLASPNNALSNMILKSEEIVEVENNELKVNIELNEEGIHSKRRRGRPRKIRIVELTKDVRLANVEMESLIEIDIKSEDMQMNDVALGDVDALESGNEQFCGFSDSNRLSDNCNSDVDQKKDLKTAQKRLYSHKTQVSRSYDDFIAKNFKLNCCVCNKELVDFAELKSHFRSQHNIRGYVFCCGKKLLKRGVLVDHIRTHQDPQYFKCPRCEKVMADRRCLEMHLKNHEDKRERIYHCEVCSKSFYRRSVFSRHRLLHVPEDEKIVPCPECEKTFATNCLMKQHLRLVHLNVYAKICDICGKTLRGREALKRHQEEHSGLQRAPIQCDECGVTLTTKYGLARHMKVMHSEENLKPQICPICSKVSPSLSAHQRHLRYMHSMQRKHACPMCEKAFKRTTDLKEHMTTHTGEVLYTCPHCPKTFNSNANMHSHRKKAHRKEWEEKRKQKYHIVHVPPFTSNNPEN